MPLSKTSTDHKEIRKWVEDRGGKPVCVRRTGSATDAGVLRISFPGYSSDKSLEEIPWDEFFKKFDENELALVFQEKTASGDRSNFNKFVKRSTAESKRRPRNSTKAASTRKRANSRRSGQTISASR